MDVATAGIIEKWIVGKIWTSIVFRLLLNFDKLWVYYVTLKIT